MQNIIFGLIGLLVGAGGVYLLLVSKLQHQLEGARRKLERAEQAGGDALDLQQQLQETQARYQDLESRYQSQLTETQPTDGPLIQELEELRQRLQQQAEEHQTQLTQFQAERENYQQQIADLQHRLESPEPAGQGNALLGGVAAAGLAGVAGWAAHEFLSEETPAPPEAEGVSPEVLEGMTPEVPDNFAPAPEENRVDEAPAPDVLVVEDAGPTEAPLENWVDEAPAETASSFEAPSWEIPLPSVEEETAPEPEPAAAEIPSPFAETSDNWVDTGDLEEGLASEATTDFPELISPESAELSEEPGPQDFNLTEFGDSPVGTESEVLLQEFASPVLEELPEESPLLLEDFGSTSDELELPADFLAEIPTDQPETLIEEVGAVEEAMALPADFLAEIPLEPSTTEGLMEEIPSAGEELDFLLELQQGDVEAGSAEDLFADFSETPDDAEIPGLDLFTEEAGDMPDLPVSGAGDNLADPFINILDTSVDTPDHELLELLQTTSGPDQDSAEGDFLEGLDDLFGEEKPAASDDSDFGDFFSAPEAEAKLEEATDSLDSLEELLASDPLASDDWGLPSEPSSEYPFQ
jgi:hypothetical protein